MNTTAPAVAEPAPEVLLSVVYGSTATTPFSEVDLAILLGSSRLKNQERGLSGLLLHRNGQFMQVLEGPEAAVRELLATIAADPRHSGVRAIDEEIITRRRYTSWAMGYRSVPKADHAFSTPNWFGSPEFADHHDDSRASQLLDWFRGA